MRIIYQNEEFFILIKKICNSMRLKEISIPKFEFKFTKGLAQKYKGKMRSFGFLHFILQN